jgi:DHA1 family tetracycline resistance protein-like MFS transporter
VQGGFMRRAAGRYRETSLVYSGVALQMTGFVGMVLVPQLGLAGLLSASALLAIGNGLTQPSLSAYISRLADPLRQGETLSSSQSLSSLARVFGPALAGYLYVLGRSVPFMACAAIALLGLFVSLSMRSIQPPATSSPAAAAH